MATPIVPYQTYGSEYELIDHPADSWKPINQRRKIQVPRKPAIRTGVDALLGAETDPYGPNPGATLLNQLPLPGYFTPDGKHRWPWDYEGTPATSFTPSSNPGQISLFGDVPNPLPIQPPSPAEVRVAQGQGTKPPQAKPQPTAQQTASMVGETSSKLLETLQGAIPDTSTDQTLNPLEQKVQEALAQVRNAGSDIADARKESLQQQGMIEYAPGVGFSWGKGGPPKGPQTGTFYAENTPSVRNNAPGPEIGGEKLLFSDQIPGSQIPVTRSVPGPREEIKPISDPNQSQESWEMLQGMKQMPTDMESQVLKALLERMKIGSALQQMTPDPTTGLTPPQTAGIAERAAGRALPNSVDQLKVAIAQQFAALLTKTDPESVAQRDQLKELLLALEGRTPMQGLLGQQ